MPDDRSLTLRQVDGARTDFALIEAELDFVKGQLAAIPKRDELWRVALLAMLSGSALTISLALHFGTYDDAGANCAGCPALSGDRRQAPGGGEVVSFCRRAKRDIKPRRTV